MSNLQLQELNSFIGKFLGLWRNGVEANLNISSRDGQAVINLQAGLGQAPPSLIPHHPQFYQRVSPSQLRRRKRREDERKEANVHANKVTPGHAEEAVHGQAEEAVHGQAEEAVSCQAKKAATRDPALANKLNSGIIKILQCLDLNLSKGH